MAFFACFFTSHMQFKVRIKKFYFSPTDHGRAVCATGGAQWVKQPSLIVPQTAFPIGAVLWISDYVMTLVPMPAAFLRVSDFQCLTTCSSSRRCRRYHLQKPYWNSASHDAIRTSPRISCKTRQGTPCNLQMQLSLLYLHFKDLLAKSASIDRHLLQHSVKPVN